MNHLSQINRNLHRLVFAMDRQAEELLQKHFKITFSQFRMLMAVHHSGKLCQAEVAKFHGLTAAAVSRQIELLKNKKIIQISQDTQNRRQHLLTLTPAGRKQTHDALSMLDKHFGLQYKLLSGEEQKIFAKSLEILVGAMCPNKHVNK